MNFPRFPDRAARGQSLTKQLLQLNIELARLVNNRRARIAFVKNQKDLLQVRTSVPCKFINVTNSFEAHFVNFIALWLFPH